MAGRLVTIATFDQPAKARLAQNALTEAGIKATVADETTVAMDWLLGAAVGWVKVQVLEEDSDRAVTVLEESLGTPDEPVDTAAMAAEAETAAVDQDEEPPPPQPAAGEASEPPPSERDEYAHRFFLAAVFGLVFAPLWFYALYLFLNAAFGEGSLSARGQSKLLRGGVALVFGAFMALFLFRIYGALYW